jgi:hypothetical protein
MSIAWAVAKRSAIVSLLGIMVALLPDAPAELEALTIPSVIWEPLVAVLHLDRYFPISTLLAIAGVAISIRVAMFGFWLYSWVAKHVFGGS